MVASNIREMLGTGIYSIQEAALYARLSSGMIGRWLFGNSKGKAVLESQYHSNEKLVSFLDLVQTLAIREIRQQHKINLKKVREAIREAKDKHGMQYPFAMQHYTYLKGEEIVINPPGVGLVEASGKHRGQKLFPFVELYLKSLSFDPSGIANIYTIFKHDNISIEMKPGIRFGEPMTFRAGIPLERSGNPSGPREELSRLPKRMAFPSQKQRRLIGYLITFGNPSLE